MGLQQAREVWNDTRVWWERLLNMGPTVFLSKELGPQHSVTWEAFLHHICLVSWTRCHDRCLPGSHAQARRNAANESAWLRMHR